MAARAILLTIGATLVAGVALLAGIALEPLATVTPSPTGSPAPSSPPQPTPAAQKDPATSAKEPTRVGASVRPPDRDVTPKEITQPPSVTGPLVRVDPLPSSRAPQRPPPKTRKMRPVVVLDGGTLQWRGTRIRLAGIVPLSLDRMCTTSDGASWPCGVAARTALRRLIRRRAVVCGRDDEAPFTGPVIEASCRVANQDLATWLMSYGWATPRRDDDEAAGRLVATARSAGRGQWRTVARPAPVATVDAGDADMSLRALAKRMDLDLTDIGGSVLRQPLQPE